MNEDGVVVQPTEQRHLDGSANWEKSGGALGARSQDEIVSALGAEVADALALTERRVEVEGMQLANDAALVRIAQKYKMGIAPLDILSLRVATLVEVLCGGMDDERRIAYERAVQVKFTTIIADIERQAVRAALLNGVRFDPPKMS